jgi:hypothetical protein
VSWPEGFATTYDEWSARMTEDIPFYVDLAREADGPIVELAVGTGRVAIPVAQATGRIVIGIDSSPAMLEKARTHASDAGVELDLREGDMREFAVDERAALIYCPYLHSSTSRYGQIVGGRSSVSPALCCPVGDSRGTSSSSIIALRPDWKGGTRSRSRTRSAMPSVTGASISPSSEAGRAHSGGQRRTNGSA